MALIYAECYPEHTPTADPNDQAGSHNGPSSLRKQGPRHTPQMHRSLEAYCATLGPPPPI